MQGNKHSMLSSITYICSTIDTNAPGHISVNTTPLNVLISTAELLHGHIKSDVYDCRFDFSTCLYLLGALCLLPSAVPDFCFYLPMPHLSLFHFASWLISVLVSWFSGLQHRLWFGLSPVVSQLKPSVSVLVSVSMSHLILKYFLKNGCVLMDVSVGG